jgi:CHAT domain-containing protein/tetratricopeptide (TPR) repeat protein
MMDCPGRQAAFRPLQVAVSAGLAAALLVTPDLPAAGSVATDAAPTTTAPAGGTTAKVPAAAKTATVPAAPQAPAILVEQLNDLRDLIGRKEAAAAESRARALLADLSAAGEADTYATALVVDVLVASLLYDPRIQDPEILDLAERAIRIKESLGADLHEQAVSWRGLGNVRFRRGEGHALECFQRAYDLWTRSGHAEDLEFAKLAHNLAVTLGDLGRGPQCLPYFRKVVEVRERLLPPTHPDLARSLRYLGSALLERETIDEASRYLDRAYAIVSRDSTANALEMGEILGAMAVVAWKQDDLAKARETMERSLDWFTKGYARSPGTYAVQMSILGLILCDLGEVDAGLGQLERARQNATVGTGGPTAVLAQILTNLGLCHLGLGHPAEAIVWLQRAAAMGEQLFPEGHSGLGAALYNLGIAYDRVGDRKLADSYLRRALEIETRQLGPVAADLMFTLSALGNHQTLAGELDAAVGNYERAERICIRASGPLSRDLAAILPGACYLRAQRGELDEAMRTALRIEEIRRTRIRSLSQFVAEPRALHFATTLPSGLDLALSLALDHSAQLRWDPSRTWDALVRSRGIILDEMAARHQANARASSPGITGPAQAARAARQEWVDLLVRGPAIGQEDAYPKLLKQAEERRNKAEDTLARASAEFRKARAERDAGWTEIAAALPAGSALVAYVEFSRVRLDANPRTAPTESQQGGTGSGHWELPRGNPWYAAYVLGRKGVVLVSLGPATSIDPLVARWRHEAARAPAADGRNPTHSEEAYRAAADSLRRVIWDPVANTLGHPDRVFVVPDGALQAVNLSALSGPDGSYLVESGPLLHYLTTERDLVSLAQRRTGKGSLLALGAPAFDSMSPFSVALSQAGHDESVQPGTAARGASRQPTCDDFQSLRFEQLRQAQAEVEAIAGLWRERGHGRRAERPAERGAQTVLLGENATEAAFKARAPSCGVLHLATHGFYLGGGCTTGPAPRAEGLFAVGRDSPIPRAMGRNPLLMSGLALAGANQRALAGKGMEDGIVTAEEIAGLDLSGVEWAVLSACETGLGETLSGEGVFGLRRAFQLAGARTVITSLWSVEDEPTKEWMIALYDSRLRGGLDTDASVRAACRVALQRLRQAGASTHPFSWGGFVAVGDWR